MSTIDYFISTVYTFPLIHSFDVFEFESLYSDAHCAVMLSINILSNPIKIGRQQVNDPNPKTRLWDDRKGALFVKNSNENELQNIKASLSDLTPQTVSQAGINKVVEQIEKLFNSSAQQSFGNKTTINNKNKGHEKWFNKECHEARNVYHHIRKLYNRHKTAYFKTLLTIVSKEYKSKISQNMKKFKNQTVSKL